MIPRQCCGQMFGIKVAEIQEAAPYYNLNVVLGLYWFFPRFALVKFVIVLSKRTNNGVTSLSMSIVI